MNDIIRNNRWLWGLKITAALFQIPATWHVFMRLFQESGRGVWESRITTLLAILLIDAFFLAVLYLLESDASPLDKLPWALAGIGLLAANLVIGFLDEGWLAWGPRIGFIGLVLTDLFAWVTSIVTQYFSREQIEKRLRDKQVLHRRRLYMRAWKKAMKDLYPSLIEMHQQRETRSLNLDEPVVRLLESGQPEEVAEGVYYENGGYHWVSPVTNEVFYQTAAGKPYTLRGAQQARTRHINQQESAW